MELVNEKVEEGVFEDEGEEITLSQYIRGLIRLHLNEKGKKEEIGLHQTQ